MGDDDTAPRRPKVLGSSPGKGTWYSRPREFAELRMMSLKLEPEMHERLEERAAADGSTVSALCRSLLAKGLNDWRSADGGTAGSSS